MEELIQTLQSKIGLSPDQAQQTVQEVISYLKNKLPEPLQEPVAQFLTNPSSQILGDLDQKAGDLLGGLEGKLGGLFGSKD